VDSTLINFISNTTPSSSKIMGPHLKPKFLKSPIRVYYPNLDKNKIGVENRNRAIIYQ
jgi:hypothetical protein